MRAWSLPLFLLGGLLMILFFGIYYSFQNDPEGGIRTFLWTVNADWMMHLAQVQAFAHRPFLEVIYNHPLYSGEVLSYPFFVNWFSGMLLMYTQNLVLSMTLPLYIGSVFFLGGIFFLVFTLTKNLWVSVLTPFFIFFLSGFQGVFTLFSFSWEEFSVLWDYQYDLDFLMGNGFNWKSVLLTTYLPQRSFLWGMGLGTLLLGVFIRLFERYQKDRNKTHQFHFFFLLGIGLGCLSMVHTHTFFWFFFLFAGLMVVFWRFFLVFLFVGAGALCSSFPFLFLLLQKEQGMEGQFSFFPLSRLGYEWLDFSEWLDPVFHIVVYWIWNLGIGIMVSGVLLVRPVFRKVFPEASVMWYPVYVVSWGLFLVFSVVQLQDNPWDNTKVHLWSVLFFSIALAGVICFLWNKKLVWSRILSVLCMIGMCFGGVVQVISGFDDMNNKQHVEMFSAVDVYKAKSIAEVLPVSDNVLVPDDFHHFFSPLLPNSIFLGNRGWIASYGMDWKSRVRIAQKIYLGDKNALGFIRQYKIGYVVTDPWVQPLYRVVVNIDFFEKNAVKVREFSDGTVLWKF